MCYLYSVVKHVCELAYLSSDIGMEHFVKKVEAAHCVACDLFIPMQYGIIQKHLKSLDHNHNRRVSIQLLSRILTTTLHNWFLTELSSRKTRAYILHISVLGFFVCLEKNILNWSYVRGCGRDVSGSPYFQQAISVAKSSFVTFLFFLVCCEPTVLNL